jgi:hypothetical protein
MRDGTTRREESKRKKELSQETSLVDGLVTGEGGLALSVIVTGTIVGKPVPELVVVRPKRGEWDNWMLVTVVPDAFLMDKQKEAGKGTSLARDSMSSGPDLAG